MVLFVCGYISCLKFVLYDIIEPGYCPYDCMAYLFPVVNNPPANAGDAWGMGWEDFLEEETTTHSSIHA